MTEKLKPCPFCGGSAEISGGTVYCPVCEISFTNERIKGADAIEEVTELWNYRPKEKQLDEQIREMKRKNDALKREILEAREDNRENMEYHVAERGRLRELLKSCCNEFAPRNSYYPVCCRNEWGVDAQGHCLGKGECPIYRELTKGAEND